MTHLTAFRPGVPHVFATQLFVKGDAGNDRDGIYKSLGDRKNDVTADFAPLPGSKMGELAANWEIVVGHTPEEPERRGPGGRGPGRPVGPPPAKRDG